MLKRSRSDSDLPAVSTRPRTDAAVQDRDHVIPVARCFLDLSCRYDDRARWYDTVLANLGRLGPEPTPSDIDARRAALRKLPMITLGAFARTSDSATVVVARERSEQLTAIVQVLLSTNFPLQPVERVLSLRCGSAREPVQETTTPEGCSSFRFYPAMNVLRGAKDAELHVAFGMGLSALPIASKDVLDFMSGMARVPNALIVVSRRIRGQSQDDVQFYHPGYLHDSVQAVLDPVLGALSAGNQGDGLNGQSAVADAVGEVLEGIMGLYSDNRHFHTLLEVVAELCTRAGLSRKTLAANRSNNRFRSKRRSRAADAQTPALTADVTSPATLAAPSHSHWHASASNPASPTPSFARPIFAGPSHPPLFAAPATTTSSNSHLPGYLRCRNSQGEDEWVCCWRHCRQLFTTQGAASKHVSGRTCLQPDRAIYSNWRFADQDDSRLRSFWRDHPTFSS